MPRCYMVKKASPREDRPPPCSPMEATVAPPCYTHEENAVTADERGAQCVELGRTPMSERSAEDTEAAHELLSLAQSVPPLPPLPSAAVLTVFHAPVVSSVVPVYAYTIPCQTTNLYIVADQISEPVFALPATANVHTSISNEPSISVQTDASIALEPSTCSINEPISTINSMQTVECTFVVAESSPSTSPELLNTKTDISNVATPATSEICTSSKGKPTKYKCDMCGKRYATSSNLSRHKQTHRSLDSKAAKRCKECGKKYVSMAALSMHEKTHRMGHVCAVCGKQFSRSWLLRGHLRLHTGEKPYSCDLCGKTFADRSNLRAHSQTHSSDKKHQCNRCTKKFALKSYVNKHQESACMPNDDE